jgi:hypothetical protein
VVAVDPLAGILTVESGWSTFPLSQPTPVERPARTWGNDLSPRPPLFDSVRVNPELVTVTTDAGTAYRVVGSGQTAKNGVTTGSQVIVVMQLSQGSQNAGLARSVMVLPLYVAGGW